MVCVDNLVIIFPAPPQQEPDSTGCKDKLSPVLVFIHGGAYYTGTANSHIYGPDYLLREDVVLVTVQYRLGAMGKVVRRLSRNFPN